MEDHIHDLLAATEELNTSQIQLLTKMAHSLNTELEGEFNSREELVDQRLWTAFGERLLVHHSHTARPISHKQFEYTLEEACIDAGRHARLNTSSNDPSWDIDIDGERFSLKTSTVSRPDRIFISKISEAAWIGDHVERYTEDGKPVVGDINLEGLCEGVHNHLVRHVQRYDRILKLRTFDRDGKLEYRFVEIPRGLLLEMTRLTEADFWRSAQKTVRAKITRANNLLFEVNIDVSVEKLKITHLDVSNCIVQAHWIIPVTA